VKLTEQEVAQLLAFLRALDSPEPFQTPAELPPSGE
jgi:hypothetical protein